ncbi:MAG: radical SAM/SPASM domain-containing protein [Fibrobacterota bacterium]
MNPAPVAPTGLDPAIFRLFRRAVRLSLARPSRALFFLRTLFRQRKAAALRRARAKEGLAVPPFLILSVTRECNLNCRGCYEKALPRPDGAEMDAGLLQRTLFEAQELGVGMALLAGGEPLMRPGLLDTLSGFPGMVFPLFTNGQLLDDAITERLAGLPQVVPVISLEGEALETDRRRGYGVHKRAIAAVERLQEAGLFFGLSLTLTHDNFDAVMEINAVSDWIRKGCGLFFFIEYVPAGEGTEGLALTPSQRARVLPLTDFFRKELPALFLSFPGDEADFGGCLAAGRGFVHVSADGRVEPCPFSPYSDSDLKQTSLRAALGSPFLKTLRENPSALSEAEGGCALFAKKEWVETLLKKSVPHH